MNEVDKAAFADWYRENAEDDLFWLYGLDVWQAALEHRHNQTSKVNEQLLCALEGFIRLTKMSHGVVGYSLFSGHDAMWEELSVISEAEDAIAAAKQIKEQQ